MSSKVSLTKRIVKGKIYYYLDKNFKNANGKWKKASVYVGVEKPDKKKFERKRRELEQRIFLEEKNLEMVDTYKHGRKRLPRICLVFCGGTIAMKRNEHGALEPTKKVEDLTKISPEIKTIVDLDSVFVTNIDSTNMQPSHWSKIAKTIYDNYDKYDGFVITHGTDTMAYTASALSFALQNLNKPIVLTGSQMPPGDLATDAHVNLINACRVAAMNLRGVIICFGTRILQGNRSKKWSEVSQDAFVSHLTPDIGEIATTIQIAKDAPKKLPNPKKLLLKNKFEEEVLQITLLPGMNPDFIERVIETNHLKGIILESFGAGNVPTKENSFIPLIKKATKIGIPVIVTTQCAGGTSSHMLTYEVGYEAIKAGAIPARDMTAECAATKLMWVLAQTQNIKEIKKKIIHNYTGELRT